MSLFFSTVEERRCGALLQNVIFLRFLIDFPAPLSTLFGDEGMLPFQKHIN